MAVNTDKTLQHQLIYSVFVRNHTPEGTFRALERDLDRLSALGTDIVWLMPIHPIGEVGRKGTLGSPYAIRDYRGVNPEYGTVEDFRHLVDATTRRRIPFWRTPTRSGFSGTSRVGPAAMWRIGGM